MNCLMRAWGAHEVELRHWLRGQLRGRRHEADDLLQEVFLKALRQDKRFCEVANPRAWLFEVTRNTLADRLRVHREWVDLPDALPHPEPDAPPTVDALAACLPRVLAEMEEADREALTRCDLEGMTQAEFARLHGLSLAGAKSRVQRARRRLREHLSRVCQVRFDEAGQVCCFVPRTRLPG